MMKKANFAAILVCITTLTLPTAQAGVGGFDAGQYGDSAYGVTPMDFLGQADGCPYAATAMYQQYVMQQQQQQIQRLRSKGRTDDGDSLNDSATVRYDLGDGAAKRSYGKKSKKVARTTKEPRAKKSSSRSAIPETAGSESISKKSNKRQSAKLPKSDSKVLK